MHKKERRIKEIEKLLVRGDKRKKRKWKYTGRNIMKNTTKKFWRKDVIIEEKVEKGKFVQGLKDLSINCE